MMRVLSLAALCFGSLAALAAPLADPTRPPASVAGPGGAGGGAEAARLTSVMLPKSGKATAVIGDELVPLGGKVGDACLVRITETGVVLEGPTGVERLYLTPGIEKTNIIEKTPAAKRGQSKGKP